MKKLLIVFVCIVLLLCGCQNTQSAHQNTPTPTPEPTPVASPVEDFEYSIVSSKNIIQIDKYIGNDIDVIIPNKIEDKPVAYIGDYAFKDTKVETVVIPDSVIGIKTAFLGCVSLKKVELPNSITYIDSMAFMRCTSLTEINMPKNLLSIGKYAFSETNIEEITIPKLAQIGEYAFKNIPPLKTVIFEEGYEQIGSYLGEFAYCSALEKVIVPASAKKFLLDTFAYCPNLKTIEFAGNAPESELPSPVYEFSLKDITIYYNKGTTGWDSPIWQEYNLVEK